MEPSDSSAPPSAEEAWEACLSIIRDNISRQSYKTWFEPLEALSLKEEDGLRRLTVQLPSRFYYEWLEEHYFALLRKTVTKVLGNSGRLFYEVVIEKSGGGGGRAREGSSMRLPARHPPQQPPQQPQPGAGEGRGGSGDARHQEGGDPADPSRRPERQRHARAPGSSQGGGSGEGGRSREGRPQQRPGPQQRARRQGGGGSGGAGNARRGARPGQDAAGRKAAGSGKASEGAEVPAVQNPFAIPGLQKANVDSQLNDSYTFERFIQGDCNQLARGASWAIAQDPGATRFNPFLIYGGVGLGKTHLIQAIGNHVEESAAASQTVLYVSSERFTTEFVQAIQNNRINEFSMFYRGIDVLIVDDVQFFGGKEKTQEEFFHIFNALHQAGKQIVLSADRAPREIDGIEERLLSRFQWGLSADVQPPELETRIAILRRKAEDDGIELPDEIIEFMAHNIKSNIRELEGALIRLMAHATLHSREMDLSLAKDVLRDLVTEARSNLTVDEIQRIVCEHLSIEEDDLRGKTRKRDVVRARQVAMYFSKKLTGHSLKTIGLHFGGRDHSTVIHSNNRVEEQMEVDPQFKKTVEDLRRKIDLRSR